MKLGQSVRVARGYFPTSGMVSMVQADSGVAEVVGIVVREPVTERSAAPAMSPGTVTGADPLIGTPTAFPRLPMREICHATSELMDLQGLAGMG
jgi:hypothetical protein